MVDGLLKPAVQISILKYELEPKWLRSVVVVIVVVVVLDASFTHVSIHTRKILTTGLD